MFRRLPTVKRVTRIVMSLICGACIGSGMARLGTDAGTALCMIGVMMWGLIMVLTGLGTV